MIHHIHIILYKLRAETRLYKFDSTVFYLILALYSDQIIFYFVLGTLLMIV